MDENVLTPTAYRHLTDTETAQLEHQGCTAEDWSLIEIHPDTDLRRLEDVHFSGANRIGTFRKSFALPGGITRQSGIRHAMLHDTTVGDDCLIEHISDYIAHYDISPGCLILHTGMLAMTGPSSFGNGVELSVMSETGGRAIIMHDRLSAQEAYLQAMHRHAPRFARQLRAMAMRHAESRTSGRGSIGAQTRIVHCGRLLDITTGPCATLDGVTRLKNGTVCSHPAAPTFVGDQVIARDFIFQAGCHVSDGALLTRCHVGQASVVGHGFTASDTFFACNCQAENGEACAVLAGPYTVTHHKSTLLIGGMFSFMNAGSATNQSNHAYKLGPLHHGVLERGCKTASGSHLSWPARIGAFSLVMGHCAPNTDSHRLPFSYVVEQQGANYVIPGIALRSVGTLRDIRKWAKRDGRPAGVPRTDTLVFDAFSPYTMERILQGYALLTGLEQQEAPDGEYRCEGKLRIRQKNVAPGRELYRLAIDRFFGEQLLARLESLEEPLPDNLYAALRPAAPCGSRQWCDIGGLLAGKDDVDRLEDDVAEGRLTQTEELEQRFRTLGESYGERAWAWTWERLMEAWPDTTAENFATALCLPVIRQWSAAAIRLNRQIIADAHKEFVLPPPCVFGIDGNGPESVADAQAVNGVPGQHPLIMELEKEEKEIEERAGRWMRRLGGQPTA